MQKIKKRILIGALSITLIGSTSSAFAWTYQVQAGDTYWKLSQKYGVSLDSVLKANNANYNSGLNIGDKITIPDNIFYYTVKSGDTPWIISQKFGVSLDKLLQTNGMNQYSVIYVGQTIKIPSAVQGINNNQSQPGISYKTYIVQSGDDLWKISLKFGVQVSEIAKSNNISENKMLYVGDKLLIPVHNVPVKETPGAKYGEYLDWWSEAQYVLPREAQFKVIDFYTGKSFNAKRTVGTNHADVETLTANDTNIMKSIWGGDFSWVRRPVIIEYNGRRIAASATAMPHAGNEKAAGGSYTTWRSGSYGAGTNFDYIKGNGMDGHFDIHFLNSTRHKDGEVDEQHQKCVKIAAGLIK
ncbi:LysM peptidoglycan-binding domain-containing protein [Brassicibacter mesophilus]|uniref:LysM peptidoglycan-binding domain-containing protein n=1 Tax=Brassicibacter mesophilus TaxID=745119 RepID=UPI003D24A85C